MSLYYQPLNQNHLTYTHSVKSLADADAVVQIKRPWSKGHFRKGKALMALDRHEEARDAILLGLEFEPSNEVG